MQTAAAPRLNSRQTAFVLAYTTPGTKAHNNATQAAVAAGYEVTAAHVQGPRLLQHEGTTAAIREREAQLAEVAGYTRTKYVDEAKEMRDAWKDEHGKQRVETVYNRDGQPTGSRVMRPDTANVRAHELIGKAIGYLGDRQAQSKPVIVMTNVQALAQQVAPAPASEPRGKDVTPDRSSS